MKKIGFIKYWVRTLTVLIVIVSTLIPFCAPIFGQEMPSEINLAVARAVNGSSSVSCMNVWSATGTTSTEPMTIYYNQLDGGLSAPQIIFLQDENINSVFCVQYGSALATGNIVDSCSEESYEKLNSQQKEAIFQVLGCAAMVYAPRDSGGGYNGINTGDCTFENFRKYNSTQLMIWYYIDLYSGQAGSGNTGGITWEGVVRTCQAGWGNLEECERIKGIVDHIKDIPSFTSAEPTAVQPITLQYNPATKRYEALATDTTQVLSKYTILGGQDLELIRCQEDGRPDEAGNSLLICRETAMELQSNPIMLTFQKREVGGNLVFLRNQNDPQDLVFFSGHEGFAVNGYMSVTTTHTKVQIEKLDKDTGRYLEGITLQLWKGEDFVCQWITGKDPYVIYDLEIGEQYCLREAQPLDGYAGAKEIFFTVMDDQETKQLVMYNQKTTIDISKQELTGGEELPGAQLELYEGDQLIESWISDTEPHRIRGLAVGHTYTLKEILAPAGYALAEEVSFTVEDKSEVQKVVMKDAIIQGKLHLKKTDDQGKGLEGAVFYLFQKSDDAGFLTEPRTTETVLPKGILKMRQNEDDTFIGTYTTDIKGELRIEGLYYGSYYLLEETAPKGYIRSDEVYEFVIEEADQQLEMVIVNEEEPTTEEIPTEEVTTEWPTVVEAASENIEETPQTGDHRMPLLSIVFLFGAIAVCYITNRKK